MASSDPQVLFLCTGNYYRSRFAELLFNHLAPSHGLPWRAFSRGIAIELGVGNIGPIAASTLAALIRRSVALEAEHRHPLPLAETDLSFAGHIVALKRDEHLPMLAEKFPGWVGRVEFWHVHDIDQAHPRDALPQIEREVLGLLERLVLQNLSHGLIFFRGTSYVRRPANRPRFIRPTLSPVLPRLPHNRRVRHHAIFPQTRLGVGGAVACWLSDAIGPLPHMSFRTLNLHGRPYPIAFRLLSCLRIGRGVAAPSARLDTWPVAGGYQGGTPTARLCGLARPHQQFSF